MDQALRMKTVRLPSGEQVPAIGMGTWRLGENRRMRAHEIETVRLGIDLGARLIDTAEMYGDGLTEELIGEAIRDRRDQVFLVSKVLPQNATRAGTVAACERSLHRLRTDRLDLYLLHWRTDDVSLQEVTEAFMTLQRSGKIRHYGVSNFDRLDMEDLWPVPGGRQVQTDQVLYNLMRRGIEWDLLPWLRSRGIPIMAYSPFEEGRLIRHRKLATLAADWDITPAQIALAWLLRNDDVIVIPKTGNRERLNENLGALDIQLTPEQLAELDRLFPPPDGPRPLEMI